MSYNSKQLKVQSSAKKLPKPKDVDYISKMGYRDDSPFRDNPYNDIYTPNGIIDMSQTGIPLFANGQYLPPYSGMHDMGTKNVREIPVAKKGGQKGLRQFTSKNIQTSLNDIMQRNTTLFGPSGKKRYKPDLNYKYGGWLDTYQNKGQVNTSNWKQSSLDSLKLYNAYQFQKNNTIIKTGPQGATSALNLRPDSYKPIKDTNAEYKILLSKSKKQEDDQNAAMRRGDYNHTSFKNPVDYTNIGIHTPIDLKEFKEREQFSPIGIPSNYNQNKKIIDYYRSMGIPDKDINFYNSPDVFNSKIKPIGEYFDGQAYSPVYKKPVGVQKKPKPVVSVIIPPVTPAPVTSKPVVTPTPNTKFQIQETNFGPPIQYQYNPDTKQYYPITDIPKNTPQSDITIIPFVNEMKKYGGWLDSYQNKGQVSTNKIGSILGDDGRPMINVQPEVVIEDENSWLDKLKTTLNPYNWGVNDYTKSGTKDQAFNAARKAGEKEYMWNNQRYNTRKDTDLIPYIGNNPNQKEYDKTLRTQYPEFYKILNRGQNVGNISFEGSSSTQPDRAFIEKNPNLDWYNWSAGNSKIAVGQNPHSSHAFIGKLIAEAGHLKDNKLDKSIFNPYSWKVKNDQKEFGEDVYYIPGTAEYTAHRLIEPGIAMLAYGNLSPNDIKRIQKYLEVEDDGYFGETTYKALQNKYKDNEYIKNAILNHQAHSKDNDENPISMGRWPLLSQSYLHELNKDVPLKYYNRFRDNAKNSDYTDAALLSTSGDNMNALLLQRALKERGYTLPKSTTKYGDLDGKYGDETKNALLDWQNKNKKKKYGGNSKSWLDQYQPGGTFSWAPSGPIGEVVDVKSAPMTHASIAQHDMQEEARVIKEAKERQARKDAITKKQSIGEHGTVLGNMVYAAKKAEDWSTKTNVQPGENYGAYHQFGKYLPEVAYSAFPVGEVLSPLIKPIVTGAKMISKFIKPQTFLEVPKQLPGSPNVYKKKWAVPTEPLVHKNEAGEIIYQYDPADYQNFNSLEMYNQAKKDLKYAIKRDMTKELTNFQKLKKYGLTHNVEIPKYQTKHDIDLINYNKEYGTKLFVRNPELTEADKLSGYTTIPGENDALMRAKILLDYGKQPLAKANQFFTKQDLINMQIQEDKYYNALDDYEKLNPQSGSNMIINAFTGNKDYMNTFHNLNPNLKLPDWGAKFIPDYKTSQIINKKTSMFGNPIAKYLGLRNPYDKLSDAGESLLKFQNQNNWLYTGNVKDVVSEFRGSANLSLSDIKNMSNLELEKERVKIIKRLSDQTLNIFKKDIEIPYKGIDAFKTLSPNKKGGIIKKSIKKSKFVNSQDSNWLNKYQ